MTCKIFTCYFSRQIEAKRSITMQESKDLEFRECVTNSFLKTVSAYANGTGGRVLFGINDDGEAVGLDDPKQTCLDIENKINDSIIPQPDYSLKIDEPDATVELTVFPGRSKPYLYLSLIHI